MSGEEYAYEVGEADVDAATRLVVAAEQTLVADLDRDRPPTADEILIGGAGLLERAVALADLVAMIRHPKCRRYRVKVLGVERAEVGGKKIGKAVIRYQPPPSWTDDPGEIMTGWTNEPIPRLAAGIARSNVGEWCTIWQLNEPAPDDHQAVSFRRAIWVAGPKPYEPPAPRESAPPPSEELPS